MSFPQPVASLAQGTAEYETRPLVKPAGFREYDARWLYGPELNLMGVQALGLGLATLLAERGVRQVVTGHDYRSYSAAIKIALNQGLMAGGADVTDIGLAVTPMAYFAQFALDLPAVAMVTASHNENGWTGVKMGADRPRTFGPEEMTRLKQIVLTGAFELAGGGRYHFVDDLAERYMDDLVEDRRIARPLKVVCACGNGTAGAFAPKILARLGLEVVPLDTELDHSFPRYNPNPEDMAMLHAISEAVVSSGADVGFGFDGDGDRCGVVDETGQEIFADIVGVMLARDLSAATPDARFVVDVKSTGLFQSDPVLKANGARTDYFKTGHSHIKRRVSELGALAGFEKSGHYFFGPPFGRGYDDGLLSAIAVLNMLDRAPGKTLSELRGDLPKTFQTPTMSPHCADEVKYDVVDRVTRRIEALAEAGETVAGQPIAELVTVNGIRTVLADGTWGLVRASSNKPELVVVVESPTSEANMRAMFGALDGLLREHPEVGAYNQTI